MMNDFRINELYMNITLISNENIECFIRMFYRQFYFFSHITQQHITLLSFIFFIIKYFEHVIK